MVVDCHTHWGVCFSPAQRPDEWLRLPREYGVMHSVVLPHAGLLHSGRIPSDHDEMARVCAASQGQMIPFCTVNTWYAQEALAEVQRCLGQLNFRGIKFHPWLQGISTGSKTMDEVCEMAAHFDVPILFHDGTPPFSLPSQVALLALRHPGTRFILGHCGMLEYWREAIEAMRQAENLWGCICSPHIEAIRQLVEHSDTRRLVWGTDYGFSRADVFAYRLRVMDELSLSDATRTAIFDTNPRRLLRLEA